MLNFALATSGIQQTAASLFGRGSDGVRVCAWFPASLAVTPMDSASYVRAMGPVTLGAVKARSETVAEAFERTQRDVSVSINAETWRSYFGIELPLRSQTVFLCGPELPDGTPDVPRCHLYVIESEARLSGGVLEIDARRGSPLES